MLLTRPSVKAALWARRNLLERELATVQVVPLEVKRITPRWSEKNKRWLGPQLTCARTFLSRLLVIPEVESIDPPGTDAPARFQRGVRLVSPRDS
jgi:hypothetical protein